MYGRDSWRGTSRAFWQSQKRKLGQILLHSSLHPYYLKLIQRSQYVASAKRESLAAPSPESLRATAQSWSFQPCVSILLAINKPKREWLEEAINSVMAQSYENWQLCVCCQGARSEKGGVTDYLRNLAASDRRVRLASMPARGGISSALNEAGTLASGEYIGLLGQDDTLSPSALHAVIEELQNGSADIVYSNEDFIGGEGLPEPRIKPGWSPELLLSRMYLGHFLVASRTAIERVGWFRSKYDGAQDYDLVLRITDRTPEVRHVPQILYHARERPTSFVATRLAKLYTRSAGSRSLSDTAARRRWNAKVKRGPLPDTYWLKRKMEHYPSVSVIICSRSSGLLTKCLRSLRKFTRYPNWEIVVVQHTSGGDFDLPRVVEAEKCRTTLYSGPFNFSVMNNLGAAMATGDLLIFLNDDAEPIKRDWMERMASQLVREDVGVVGANLLYPSGKIQHAGVVIGMGDGAGHAGRGLTPRGSDYWPWLLLSRNVMAVTGACLGIRKQVFESLGGMDPLFPNNYNDVDLCLRVLEAGLMVIYESRARLRHMECATRVGGTSREERELFRNRWGRLLSLGDPHYSVMLRSDTEEVSLRPNGSTP
jgi:O-antigen biosynthesis protein